jgi:hypothetical protein
MKEPDFLVVGTARAGTSALHYYLRQHPEIFLPAQKEPCYYCFAGKEINYQHGKFAFTVKNGKEYGDLFRDAKKDILKGEISTPYLYLYEQTIENILRLHTNPKSVKIVIILRNPVDRAYSQYMWKVRDGREELTFDEALHQEKKRMLQNYSFDYFYAHRGLYYKQVKAYLEAFPKVKIFLFDQFRNELDKTLSELCAFLGVDDEFEFERKDDVNSSRMPRFAAIGRLITLESKAKYKMLNVLPDSVRISIKEQFMRWNSSGKQIPPMSDPARKYLNDFYKKDLLKLQTLTGINLSAWIAK